MQRIFKESSRIRKATNYVIVSNWPETLEYGRGYHHELIAYLCQAHLAKRSVIITAPDSHDDLQDDLRRAAKSLKHLNPDMAVLADLKTMSHTDLKSCIDSGRLIANIIIDGLPTINKHPIPSVRTLENSQPLRIDVNPNGTLFPMTLEGLYSYSRLVKRGEGGSLSMSIPSVVNP